MKRSTFFTPLLTASLMFGLLATLFADAGNLAVTQHSYATAPHSSVTVPTAHVNVSSVLQVGDQRSTAENATLISEPEKLTASTLSGTYIDSPLTAAVFSVHRSPLIG